MSLLSHEFFNLHQEDEFQNIEGSDEDKTMTDKFNGRLETPLSNVKVEHNPFRDQSLQYKPMPQAPVYSMQPPVVSTDTKNTLTTTTESNNPFENYNSKTTNSTAKPETTSPSTTNPFPFYSQTPAHGKASTKDVSDHELLIPLVTDIEFFADDLGDVYSKVNDVPHVIESSSSLLRQILEGRFLDIHNRLPRRSDVNNVIECLVFEAKRSGRTRKVFNRFAVLDNDNAKIIAIDLANSNGEAIIIDRNDWTVTSDHKIDFVRHPHMRELEHPDPSGSLLELSELLGVSDAESSLLFAWLACAMRTDMARPILMLHGSPGSGKSTRAKMLRDLLDPSVVFDMFPKKADELPLLMHSKAIPLFDNVGNHLSDDQSNTLCMACTGGSLSKRKLYSNRDMITLPFQRAVIMTAVNNPITASDLIDRSLIIRFERIKIRATDESLTARYLSRKSHILGGLLNIIPKALEIEKTLKINNLPRLAHFAKFGYAVSEALANGFTGDRFLAELRLSQQGSLLESVADDPLPGLIYDYVSQVQVDHVPMKVFFEDLMAYAKVCSIDPKKLPAAPNSMSRKINSMTHIFEEFGWLVSIDRGLGNVSVVTFNKA